MKKNVLANVFEEITFSDLEKKQLDKIALEFVKKDKQDVDIFVVFKKEKDLESLEKLIKKSGYKAKVVHGSRDYYHIEMELCVLEIILASQITPKSILLTE